MNCDQAARNAEYNAFDQAFGHVPQPHGRLQLGPESALVHVHHLHTDQLRPEQAYHDEYGGKQRHCNHTANESRGCDITQGVHCHDLHGGELIGGAHQPDLGGQRGSGAARKQQCRDNGPQFLEQPEGGGGTQGLFRPEPLQQLESL
jgi:hypothetical protein